LVLSHLELTAFRNYSSLSLSLPPQGCLFWGDNGAGKTNLLEAIYLVCMGKPFRGASRTQLITFQQTNSFVKGLFAQINQSASVLEKSVGFDKNGEVRFLSNGEPVATLLDWFCARPVSIVSFSPSDLSLVTGGPSVRRQFLDQCLSQLDNRYFETLVQYRKALAHRNALLQRGVFGSQMDVFEEGLAQHGWYLCAERSSFVSSLSNKCKSAYAYISQEHETVALRHQCHRAELLEDRDKWQQSFISELFARRESDARRMHTSLGPHRDELQCTLDSVSARTYASQGQARSIAFSLKVASISRFRQRIETPLIILVDDVFSELDDSRIQRLYPLLQNAGQLFFTAPLRKDPAVVDLPHFKVSDAEVHKDG